MLPIPRGDSLGQRRFDEEPRLRALRLTKNIQSKDFSWTTDFIFGSTFNKVTELDTKRNMFNFLTGNGFARQGYPVRSLFSIPFTGLDDEGLPHLHGQWEGSHASQLS